MNNFQEAFIRISAFVRKEIAAILRQPRLVAILVLGPFLILLLFGIGYRDTPRQLRTVVVVPADSHIKAEIDEILNGLRGALDIVDTVSSQDEALARLDRQEIDLVLVTPADPYSEILQSQQAQFELIHHEIDPLEILFVNTLERAYVQEINKQVLIRAVEQAQNRSTTVKEKVNDVQVDADSLHNDLEAGNGSAALRDIEKMIVDYQALNLAIASSLSLFEGVQSLEDGADESTMLLEERLEQIERQLDSLALLETNQTDFTAEIDQVEAVQSELTAIQDFFAKFQGMNGRVLVSPFAGKTVSFTQVDLGAN